MNGIFEEIDKKEVVAKQLIEKINTIVANDSMRNLIRSRGDLQDDGAYVFKHYEGNMGKQRLILNPDNTILVHSYNEQLQGNQLVKTDITSILEEDELLTIVDTGYLLHLPPTVELNEGLENALAEISINPEGEK